MLYCNSINLGKGNDVVKNNNNKESIVCHYWYFNHKIKFEKSVWNSFHDLLMLCFSIGDITSITVKGIDYCWIFNNISKSDEINFLENLVFDGCGYTLNAFQRNQYQK